MADDRQRRLGSERRRVIRFRFRQRLPLLVALVVTWMLLWGEISVLSAASGIVVAFLVVEVFVLPPVELSGRLNVFWFGVFLFRFLVDLVIASFTVAARAFGPPIRANAIIEVDLRSDSDFITTLVAIVTSITPGSFVVDVDRERSVLFLHVLGARTTKDIERMRQAVLASERRLVRALGSRADMERCRVS